MTDVEVGEEEGANVVIVVIEVDWIFNLRKPVFGQKQVGIKLRNQGDQLFWN